ncbi:type II toxin-antitoxin system PemK/MazF family toxin [Allokutzneria sp. A3M-2-11 16]|uniref:type II toxin-antitoxin system PemK/MazF family toxin n=1 Tax=Allokutzneria sp. A3M-2-11 16 TaxID=2962043 RepID=UPI0020B6FB68|nr:type II toxin-antitoxin system PemK/MazF family toxin [Allokutzneria sp. A3M-2-11 16]MCP3798697.1 type II toxin-antitoxin system PemK/MazF family toxin [Allokutzneria sp. A3M-2-11 16]
MSAPVLRGQIYWSDIGFGNKPWLVVSNNMRNRAIPSLLAVRITTTSKNVGLPTFVPLSPSDPMVGVINVDDLQQLAHEELGEQAGAVTPQTLMKVNTALKVALALP